jgi:hypothetical protein
MYFALENVVNHAFLQKLFGMALRFQVSPETICRSAREISQYLRQLIYYIICPGQYISHITMPGGILNIRWLD